MEEERKEGVRAGAPVKSVKIDVDGLCKRFRVMCQVHAAEVHTEVLTRVSTSQQEFNDVVQQQLPHHGIQAFTQGFFQFPQAQERAFEIKKDLFHENKKDDQNSNNGP